MLHNYIGTSITCILSSEGFHPCYNFEIETVLQDQRISAVFHAHLVSYTIYSYIYANGERKIVEK